MMEIVLKKSENLDDWYLIVRAHHDGRAWFEQIGPNSMALRLSERLSPEACIEGDACEMLVLARAIKIRHAAEFERCAVRFEADGAHFWSPKNSEHDAVIPLEFADKFADHVLETLDAKDGA